MGISTPESHGRLSTSKINYAVSCCTEREGELGAEKSQPDNDIKIVPDFLRF